MVFGSKVVPRPPCGWISTRKRAFTITRFARMSVASQRS
jgi:hypothetical protein